MTRPDVHTVVATSKTTATDSETPSAPGFVAYVKATLLVNYVLFLLFHVGELVSTRFHSGPNYFNLCPRGWGYLLEMGVVVIGVSFVTVFYTSTAFMVRPWIGTCLKIVFNLIFCCFLLFVYSDRCIGVAETEDGYLFVRTWPFSSTAMSPKEIRDVRFSDTGAVTAITVVDHLDRSLSLRPVYHLDTKGEETVAKLRTILVPWRDEAQPSTATEPPSDPKRRSQP